MIREIVLSDLHAFYELRLTALQKNPEAFATDAGAWSGTALDQVSALISQDLAASDSYRFGAFDDENMLVGMIGVTRPQRIKVRHKATFWGLWVEPEHRRMGIGTKLVQAALDSVRTIDEVQQIRLTVTTGTPAIYLFEKFGFRCYGLERNALIIAQGAYDITYLTLQLNGE